MSTTRYKQAKIQDIIKFNPTNPTNQNKNSHTINFIKKQDNNINWSNPFKA